MKGRARSSGSRQVTPARAKAFEILRRVEEEAAFAAPVLAAVAEELRAEDRSLCYELVLGCLRWQLWLDGLIERLSERRAPSLDAGVRRALRLGLYQLRFLTRIPPSAAVNESVNLVYQARLRSAAPFVNAVLRRATREPQLNPAEGLDDPAERIAIETSHPAWLIRRWTRNFGASEAEALARANNRPPPLSFRVNSLRATSADVLDELARAASAPPIPSKICPDAWRMNPEGDADGLGALRRMAAEGLVYMQDEASQLVAHVMRVRAGERLLDACAAPGSKTTHMAALGQDRASIVAADRVRHRLRTIGEACARLDVQGVCLVMLDAERPLPFAEASFDGALVDAPCTGTGTLRHNPEIRWRLGEADIADLARRQRRILTEAARAVRKGGCLIYSTCSVEPEENEEVVAGFLSAHGDFRQVTASPAPAALLVGEGAARTWPHRDDVDGFFVAALERNST